MQVRELLHEQSWAEAGNTSHRPAVCFHRRCLHTFGGGTEKRDDVATSGGVRNMSGRSVSQLGAFSHCEKRVYDPGCPASVGVPCPVGSDWPQLSAHPLLALFPGNIT